MTIKDSDPARLSRRDAISRLALGARLNPAFQRIVDVKADTVNVKDFGAIGDGDTDDAAAIQSAIETSPAVYCPPGRYLLGRALLCPPNRQTCLRGAGSGLTVLRSSAAAGGKIVAFTHTHLVSEFSSSIQGLTADGGAGLGPIIELNGLTLALLRDLVITNGSGTGLSLLSLYDSHFENVYIETVGDSRHPAVVLDTNMPAGTLGGDSLNNCQFYNLHIEPGDRDTILLDLVGSGVNRVEENIFYGLKLHGNPSNSNPRRPLLRLSPRAASNRFFAVLIAFGHGSSQVEISGNGNMFYAPVLGLGASEPEVGFDLIGGFNYIEDAVFKGTAYSMSYVRNRGNENVVLRPRIGNRGPSLYKDSGKLHVQYRDPLTRAYHLYDQDGWTYHKQVDFPDGFLPPRLTTVERDALPYPSAGLIIFNTTTSKLNVYTRSGWEALASF